jgi:hypothetical protein
MHPIKNTQNLCLSAFLSSLSSKLYIYLSDGYTRYWSGHGFCSSEFRFIHSIHIFHHAHICLFVVFPGDWPACSWLSKRSKQLVCPIMRVPCLNPVFNLYMYFKLTFIPLVICRVSIRYWFSISSLLRGVLACSLLTPQSLEVASLHAL